MSCGRRDRDAAPGSTELWKVDDAPHIGALGVHPAEYRARVLALFDEVLGEP